MPSSGENARNTSLMSSARLWIVGVKKVVASRTAVHQSENKTVGHGYAIVCISFNHSASSKCSASFADHSGFSSASLSRKTLPVAEYAEKSEQAHKNV